MVYFAALLINILLALWVQSDAKKLRAKGVALVPGLWSTLVFIFSVPLLIVYLLIRIVSYGPRSKKGLQPLPPAPGWTNWLTVIIILIPVAVLLIVYFVDSRPIDSGRPNSLTNSTATDSQAAQNASVHTSSPQTPIAGWKTYSSDEHGISIEYPGDFSIDDLQSAGKSLPEVIYFGSTNPSDVSANRLKWSVSIHQAYGSAMGADFYTKTAAGHASLLQATSETSQVTIDGMAATLVKLTGPYGIDNAVILQKGDKVYEIDGDIPKEGAKTQDMFVDFYESFRITK